MKVYKTSALWRARSVGGAQTLQGELGSGQATPAGLAHLLGWQQRLSPGRLWHLVSR